MHKKIKLSKSNLLLKVVAYVVMGLLAAMAILPCLHIISKAFSRGADVTAGNVVFWPKGFQLETVWYVLTKTSFLNALKNSLIVTIGGTAISMFTTITTAYPCPSRLLKVGRYLLFCMLSVWCSSEE